MSLQDFPSILRYGARGTGLWEGLMQGAAGLLCETAEGPPRPWQRQPCGRCPGCTLLRSGSHPDLRLLLPAALAGELGQRAAGSGGEAPPDGRAASRGTVGREIAIDQVRELIDWAQATSHRGGLKVALVHPLDAMAAPAANALLKVLEEPPAGLCLLAGSHRLDRVLPTLRSRCLLQPWGRPDAARALDELRRRGTEQPEAVAAWCRNAVFDSDPARGLQWTRRLVEQMAAGQAPQGDGVAPAVAVESLQKLSFDLLRCRAGLPALYLQGLDDSLRRLGGQGDAGAWQQWWRRLAQAAATADFPLHAGLAVQAWIVEWTHLCTSRAK